MATFTISVVVNPTGAIRGIGAVDGQLGRLDRSAQRLNRTFQRLFNFAIFSLAAGNILRLVDSFTQIQNRIRVVTEGTRELNRVTEQLRQISNRTRADFRSTAELYTRTAIATRELGLSQGQTLRFTESLNQAIIVSGASAREAQAGLIQLSQGLASGVLRGDELRSVLEQLPVVADVIAQELGVTRGALRDLGRDGAITSRVIIQGFRRAREEINQEFLRTIPTISQSFQVLSNQVVAFFGALDTNTGVIGRFARGIIVLSDNIDVLGQGLGIVAGILGVQLATVAIPALIGALRTLSVALLGLGTRLLPILAAAAGVTFAIVVAQARAAGISIEESFRRLRENVSGLFEQAISPMGAILGFEQRFSAIIQDVETFRSSNELAGQAAAAFVEQLQQLRGEVEQRLNLQEFLDPGGRGTDLLREQLGAIDELTNLINEQAGDIAPIEERGFLSSLLEQLERMGEAVGGVRIQFAALGTLVGEIFGPGGTLVQGIADGTARAVVFGQTFTSILRNLGQQIIQQILSNLLRIGLNFGFGALGLPGFANGGEIPAFANGGEVRGPGGPRSDSILARVSPGEFVVNARAARQNRGLLNAINSGSGGRGPDGSGVTNIFSPTINAPAGTNTEQLAREMRAEFEDFLSEAGQTGGRLEGLVDRDQ